jgi:Flp pilus assembly pilin Flp
MAATFMNIARKFHDDEEGLESLQVVMIIAIAAMIMIAAATVGKQGVDWMKTQAGNLVGKDLDSFSGGEGADGG